MARRAIRPLDPTACSEADAQLYAAHEGDPRPNPLFAADGSRRPLDANDTAQAALRNEWMDLYAAAGGPVEEIPDSNSPVGNIIVECVLGQLKVRVRTTDGTLVPGVTVSVDGIPGTRTTGLNGIADFGKHADGHYTAHGTKAWHLPIPADGSTDLAQDQVRIIDLTLDLVEIHLHLDADRDGLVDDDRTGLAVWAWGAARKGAIMLCNNDDDAARNDLDHADTLVNGGNDTDELAPVAVRRTGPTAPPNTWTATLSVQAADAARVRLFDSRSSGAAEVIGPTQGASYQLPDLSPPERVLGIEALTYAKNGFDGLVTLTLDVSDGAGQSYRERGVLRVAPWMMPNHRDPADRVYVVDNGADNLRFRQDLDVLVTAAGCASPTLHPSNDVWMQDCMEFGFANLPGQGLRTVMHPPRGRGLQAYPRSLLTADLGYWLPAAVTGGSTFDSNGNLEVTPGPVTSAGGKLYPFGRIYHGDGRPGEPFDPDVSAFLAAQIVQEPIAIDTSWLTVGHVDEIISFVPSPNPPGFKLLLASPGRALEILRDSNTAGHGNDTLLTGRFFPRLHANGTFDRWDSAEVTIADLLNQGLIHLDPTLDAAIFVQDNSDIQVRMDDIGRLFAQAIGIDPARDIVHVPILYFSSPAQPAFMDALTAGMVNMLVINNHCIAPDPFGPMVGGQDLFKHELETTLAGLGLTIGFIDDWYEYHVNLGEVHCGTNTLRRPTQANWWEFVP